MAPGIKIRPAHHADIPQCAVCYGDRHDTYSSIYPLRLRRDDVSQADRLHANEETLANELRDAEAGLKTFHVAIKEDDDKLVLGYSIWQKPGSLKKSKEQPVASGGETMPEVANGHNAGQTELQKKLEAECDNELAAKLKEESLRVKADLLGSEHWFLHQLFIHPDHQRQGVGTRLMDHGMAMIIERDPGAAIALTSSPPGQALYERYGFKEIYRFRPSVTDYDDNGKLVEKHISWPLMVRDGSKQ